MPTYNRAFCIENAINSLINQTYQNFELIIIDDGSTDNTKELLEEKYKEYFDSKKFTYRYKKNEGVCKARNLGLKLANNNWIGYLDTDNEMLPTFLEEFKNAIETNKKVKCFYAQICYIESGKIIGEPFNFIQLCYRNYIDLGVFVHHKSLVKRYGNFDVNLKRLVDWDLIIRYTKYNTPYFIEKFLLNYSVSDNYERITNTEQLQPAMDYIVKKLEKEAGKNSFLENIFSLKNNYSKTHKIVTILGMKMKFELAESAI